VKSVDKKQVLVIGLDGFPFTLANRLMDEGAMPNFKALLEEGSFSQMDSIYPTVSNSVFPVHIPLARSMESR